MAYAFGGQIVRAKRVMHGKVSKVEHDGEGLYKGIEKATECYYVDLAVGEHPVVIQAKGEHGFAARVAISELGELGSYGSFEFACGSPGPCTIDSVQQWQASLAKYKRNAHDPCGSTRIRGIRWMSGDTLDRIHPGQLEVSLVLHAYEFQPKYPSGDPECRDKF